MGLATHHIKVLLKEQKRSGFIKGNVLTLGQQNVWINLHQLKKLLRKYDLKEYSLKEHINYENKIKSWNNLNSTNLSCQALLTIIGANKVDAVDISNYESANIILNLNNPVSKDLFEKYDVIIDSGTLEHIFNTPVALENICNMLKPEGSFFSTGPSSNFIDHGFYSFSPTLYFDFFGANGFKDMRSYLREGSSRIYSRKGRLFEYRHTNQPTPLVSSKAIEVYFLAKKTLKYNSDKVVKPIQSIYRNNIIYENKIKSIKREKKVQYYKLKIIRLLKNFLLKILQYLPYELERVLFNKFNSNKSLKYIGKI